MTSIRASQGDEVLIVADIDGAGTYRLPSPVARRLGLVEGAEIDADVLRRVQHAAARHRGEMIALGLLRRRLRSRAELEVALKRRGLKPLDVAAVIGDLRRAGWIDDVRFAQAWVRDRLALKPKGATALRAELRARGVSSDVAEAVVLASLPVEREESLALEQAQRRWLALRALPPQAARRRLVGWLRRRGYGGEIVARTVKRLDASGGEGVDADSAA